MDVETHQRQRLMAHLNDGYLQPDEAAYLAFALDVYMPQARFEVENPGFSEQDRKERNAHFSRMATDARSLRDGLAIRRPVAMTAEIDWAAFDTGLAQLIRSLELGVENSQPQRPRPGRKPLDWRDDLVAVVFAHYPEGKAKVSEGSHFERTVGMLLASLGKSIGEVHGMIVDSRKRQPSPSQIIRPL